jgi:hypothetical protein
MRHISRAVLLTIAVAPRIAVACECAIEPTFPTLKVARKSWATYVGQVVAQERADDDIAWYRIRVDRSWKGPRQAEMVVQSGRWGPACGYPLRVGTRYLVVAPSEDHVYGRCGTHMHPLALSDQVMALVGKLDAWKKLPPLPFVDDETARPAPRD